MGEADPTSSNHPANSNSRRNDYLEIRLPTCLILTRTISVSSI